MSLFSGAISRRLTAVKELELADRCRSCGRDEIETDALRRAGREDVDLFVADGVGVDERLPCAVLPGFDGVVLDVLAVVEPLHGDGAVEGDGLVEVDLERGVRRWREPEGVGVVVEGFVLGSGCCADGVALLGDEVVAVDAMERLRRTRAGV